MPSIFSKRSKSKNGSHVVIELKEKVTNPTSNTMKLAETNRTPHIKPVLKPSPKNQSALKSNRRRASSTSPQRKAYTNSVTFESTLPTQIWQASPNPSPPPINFNHSPDKRMFNSVVEVPPHHQQRVNGQLVHQDSIGNDPHEINTNALYKCLSDEIIHHKQTPKPSLISSSDTSSDDDDDELVAGMKSTNVDKNSRKTCSSSSTTATTDSNSSLDMQPPIDGESQTRHSNAKFRSDRLNGKKKSRRQQAQDKRRRKKSNTMTNTTIHSSTSSSSSTKSSSSSTSEDDEELVAFGWDEKTIRAVANNRLNKNRLAHGIKQPEHNKPLSNKQMVCPVSARLGPTRPLITNDNYNSMLKYGIMSPNHPQSCLLARRNNLNYGNKVYQPGFCEHQQVMNKKTLNSELLAVVTTEYEPSIDWKQQYKVLGVHRGDYVSVLSAPMVSRHSPSSTDMNKQANNSWLYVRRWCVDHLVATGAPGFVPRHYCRLLQSSEILNMWHQTRLSHSVPHKPNHYDSTQKTTNIQSVSSNPCGLQINEHASQYKSPYEFLQEMRRDGKPMNLPTNHSRIPPPPPGFLGSGGSIGSETEDRDSGRGPSSGSEWGSGRGGSSTIMLDGQLVLEQALYGGRTSCVESDTSFRVSGSVDDAHLGWFPNDVSSEHGSNREFWSPDSAMQSPSGTEELTPQLSLKTLHYSSPSAKLEEFSSPITLTTRISGNPVLELRSTMVNTSLQSVNRHQDSAQNGQLIEETSSCWEPYKTVIHVNENSMEKFTLV